MANVGSECVTFEIQPLLQNSSDVFDDLHYAVIIRLAIEYSSVVMAMYFLKSSRNFDIDN